MARQNTNGNRLRLPGVRSWRIALSGFLFFCLCLAAGRTLAADSPSLFEEISRADTELFDAFNACDLETTGAIFAQDLEFYHDTGGLTDYPQTMANVKDLCDRKLGLRRVLVEGSLEVYPMGDDGAIQVGKHTFCHLENGKNDCGTFGFTHVWRRTPEGWRLFRVVSYGH